MQIGQYSYGETMNIKNIVRRTVNFLRNRKAEYELTAYKKTLSQILSLESVYSEKSDRELEKCFNELKKRAQSADDLSDLVVESFSIVRETIRRQLDLDPFEEQMLAGLAMLDKKIVDMKTGEGKTLAALFPICTASLLGKGVQVLTFNDYLAQRDAIWAANVFTSLGLSCGFIQQGSSSEQRSQVYGADICYLTAKEFGFDYLRDGNCRKSKQKVQREFHFVLIDEADSILIDEARSPLIIADGMVGGNEELTHIVDIVRTLDPDIHLVFDEHKRNVSLSEDGINLFENRLKVRNLYDQHDSHLITKIQYAAEAQYLLSRDIDYIVIDNQIKLVDEFTGRSAEKRRWPDGLHDAVEAKENIAPRENAAMIDSVSLHDLFKLVPQITGMTGTAVYSAEEFRQFYGLNVAVIPVHKACQRIDLDDRVFSTLRQKNNAVVKDISAKHASGRPVLVGTSSISESSHIATLLDEMNVPCRLLNALNDDQEAIIVKAAGHLGAVTISTNMAGRGTDIVLGGGDPHEKKKVEELGGLYVIGTNRHESERIDNQLRGRAGRQGDIGSSRFFISLDDPLFEKFGFRGLIEDRLPFISKITDDQGEINSTPLKQLVIHLQKVIDGENLEIKKTLSKYSGFKEKQRLHMRTQRDEILFEPNFSEAYFHSHCQSKFLEIKHLLTSDSLGAVSRAIMLSCLDKAWAGQLADLADLQSCISLRAMGGRQPFLEFRREANQWFIEHLQSVEENAKAIFESLEVENGRANLDELGVLAPSSTWTYQINDEMFNDMRDALIRQPGLAAGLALYGGPLFLLALWFNSRRKRKSSPKITEK